MTVITNSVQETESLACRIAPKLAPGNLLVFRGGLGVGKTAFCRGLARGLGCTDEVSSPTFSIVNYYRGPRPLAHFDLYRIHTQEDLCTTGFYDYLDAGVLVAVEWGENMAELLGEADVTVTLERLTENRRRITLEGKGWAEE